MHSNALNDQKIAFDLSEKIYKKRFSKTKQKSVGVRYRNLTNLRNPFFDIASHKLGINFCPTNISV